MKLKVIVHPAEEGGYWAEVLSIPGCATQGETFKQLLQNLYEAIEGCLSVDVSPVQISKDDRILEIAVSGLTHNQNFGSLQTTCIQLTNTICKRILPQNVS